MSTKKLQILDSVIKEAQNADTVDGMHASDFVSADDFEALVGDTSVSEQIVSILQEKADVYMQNDEPEDAVDGDLWIDLDDEGISFVDDTLSLSGYAADAAVVGSAISDIENKSIGLGLHEYESQSDVNANAILADYHKLIFNASNTPYSCGFFDVSVATGSGFSSNSEQRIIYQTMREWNTTNKSSRVSTDGGATWTAWSATGVVNLWYNTSPKEDFEGQTVTFNSDGYRLLLICFKNYKTLDAQKTMMILPNSGRTYGMTGLCASGSPTTFTLANRVLSKTSSGITFKDAYISGDSETHNEYCIPWVVYGIGF